MPNAINIALSADWLVGSQARPSRFSRSVCRSRRSWEASTRARASTSVPMPRSFPRRVRGQVRAKQEEIERLLARRKPR